MQEKNSYVWDLTLYSRKKIRNLTSGETTKIISDCSDKIRNFKCYKKKELRM